MSPARWPRGRTLDDRLLVVDPRAERFEEHRVGDLGAFVRRGDLFVVNDAATLPASLRGTAPSGAPVEVRLLASRTGSWRAVLFGAGDWRTRTEDRPPPPPLREGDVLRFAPDLSARVVEASRSSDRLVVLRFEQEGDAFWRALYRHGRPVQYAHIAGPLPLWPVQTPFASRPWASEMPSAGRPLSWELVLSLQAAGARFASVTHAAGLSATGDARLDASMPLRESFDVPVETALAVNETRTRGGWVVAVGTSVVRALESATLREGGLHAATGETDLVIDGAHTLRAVDALFTGMHEPGTSHDALLHAFSGDALLVSAYADAEKSGFLGHEFGDSMFIGAGTLSAQSARATPPRRGDAAPLPPHG